MLRPDQIGPTLGGMKVMTYLRTPVSVHAWDPRSVEVVDALRQEIQADNAGQVVEHIGSTAVPGLAGKGIVDLMLPADPSAIPALVESLKALGFQASRGFPVSRPLLLGTVELDHDQDQDQFVVHLHVIPADSDEVAAQRGLAQALRDDPGLREEYADLKQSIVDSGTTDPLPYSMGKIRWVLATLERLGLPSLPDPGAPPPSDSALE